jgi:hypothetical protein
MTNPKQSVEQLAAGQLDLVDRAALGRIATLYSQLDPMPDGLIDRVQFGMTLEALHSEIAELQRSADLVGVRSDGDDVSTVTFTSARLTTMVTLTVVSTDVVRIDGWVVPGEAMAIALRLVGGNLETVSDADGRFVFENVPRGLAQFVLRPPSDGDDSSVVTPSIEI